MIFNELTSEQITKIANNYIINFCDGLYQILGVIKYELGNNNINDRPMYTVNVKVLNKFGKKSTIKVYIHSDWDNNEALGNITGYNFRHTNALNMLDLDLLPNTVFTMSFEEATKKAELDNEDYKLKTFVDKVKSQINYNVKQNKSATAAKRSYVKFGVEKLQSIIEKLDSNQQNYLLKILDVINSENKPKQTVKEYIKTLTGVKKDLFEQIEATFAENEERIFENAIKWIRSDAEFPLTEEKILSLATDYIEEQKWNLFKGIINYLGNLDIIEAKNIEFTNDYNGFEGSWELTLADGSKKTFTTHSIVAEGSIQRVHYRYLVNLK